MKILKIFLVILAAGVMLLSCTKKDRSGEEKITIRIEREDEQAKEKPEVKSLKSDETAEKKVPPPVVKKTPPQPAPAVKKQPEPSETVAKEPGQQPVEKPLPDEKITGRMDFRKVAENLNPEYHSLEHMRDYWRKVKGSTVTWGGTVRKIKRERNELKVVVYNPGVRSQKKANIVLVRFIDEQRAQYLSKGEIIRFRGKIAKFVPGNKDTSAIVVLKNVQIF